MENKNALAMNSYKSQPDNKADKDDKDGKENVEVKLKERDTWSGRLDFILSCVGFAVGLGNIWRFPYLCYKNGGGAFFVPYLVFLVCGGIPILMLEIGLGQYMSRGGLAAWQICPLFQGIGVATIVVDFLLNIYYIMILAWSGYYLVQSFSAVLPWSHCNNTWNTNRCKASQTVESALGFSTGLYSNSSNTSTLSLSMSLYNVSNHSGIVKPLDSNLTTVDPTVEYWERQVLQISDGIDTPGGIRGELAVSLLVVWIIVYLCVWRGVKWTGKIVYFTATFPYIILTALVIRGVTLDGALDGIIYYLKPDFSRLLDQQVWIDGGTQVFFSYAIALGAMIGLGSYNKFNNNFYRDCSIIACINSGTSVFSGFAVFSVLGFMAKQQGVDIDDVADKGPGLVFITYPKAITQMPLPQVWAVMFFLMIFTVGLDSQFVGVESFVTHFVDIFPKQLYDTRVRMVFTAVYCTVSYIIGLSMVSKGGMFVFQLFDYYSASGMVLLWLCFWQSIVIGWIFGADKFYDAIEMMIGYRVNSWLKICWKFLTPILTMAIFLFQIIDFTPITYNGTYKYPAWAQAFGLFMALISMICVPIFIVCKLSSSRGTILEKIRWSTLPILRPHQIHSDWNLNKEEIYRMEAADQSDYPKLL